MAPAAEIFYRNARFFVPAEDASEPKRVKSRRAVIRAPSTAAAAPAAAADDDDDTAAPPLVGVKTRSAASALSLSLSSSVSSSAVVVATAAVAGGGGGGSSSIGSLVALLPGVGGHLFDATLSDACLSRPSDLVPLFYSDDWQTLVRAMQAYVQTRDVNTARDLTARIGGTCLVSNPLIN